MTNAQEIVLRRLSKVTAPQAGDQARPEFVASLNKNIESIGFTFAPKVVARLVTWNPKQLLAFAESLIPQLLKMVGGDVSYRPMYPNFPTQVMEMEEAELYVNAMMHYLGDAIGTRILPSYEKETRPELPIQSDHKLLELADDDEVTNLCRSLVSSNTSLSKSDQNDLVGLLADCKDRLCDVLPDSIPFKEVQAVVCAFLIDHSEDATELLATYLRTATDLLRFATELSGGDSSLAKSTKFKSFSRKHRRVMLGVLDRIGRPDEDLNRHRGKWIRLAERLHPGEFSKRFPKAFEAIRKLRNDERSPSFQSKVENCLREKDVVGATHLLKARPGDFARRLDHLLRTCKGDSKVAGLVIDAFGGVAGDVSTPVLLQLIAHFQHRASDRKPRSIADVPSEEELSFFEAALRKITKPSRKKTSIIEPMRTVFPKGQTAKLVRIPLAKELVDPESATAVVDCSRSALTNRFRELPPLGKCYVSPELIDYTVPFSQRSASKSLRTLARGSRLNLPDANVVRLFLWWKEGKVRGQKTGRIDIDLSATIFGENWKYLDHISYTNLKSKKLGCFHSGDITSAPKGASEFIDLDISQLKSAGAQFVVCSVLSFTNHPFCDLPQCYTGWMAREKANSGEVYEPATVQDKIDLASDRRISIPMVIDLRSEKVIWSDLALNSVPGYRVNTESNQRGIVHYGVGIESMVKPDLHELFTLHANARGQVVESAEEADTVFSESIGVTPFDFELITSEYLTSESVTADSKS